MLWSGAMLRTVFVAVLVLHGLIHLLGVAKGFGLAEVARLRQPVSRGAAVLWLAAAVATLLAAVLVVVEPDVWWAAGLPSVVLSQIAIFTSWQDAKAGTAANVLVALPLVLSLVDLRAGSLRSRYDRDARAVAAPAPAGEAAPVTEADVAALPPVAAAWLRRVGVVGKPRTRALALSFRGQLRAKPDADWMDVRGMQTSTFGEDEGTRRLFFVDGRMVGLPFHAYHRFVGPEATMEVRALSVVDLVAARGQEMNQSETVTILNDMCVLAPSSLLSPSVRLAAVPDAPRQIHVSYTRLGITVSADLELDAAGDLVSFTSDDRYLSADGKTFTRLRWVTPLHDPHDFHGLRLPRTGEAIWKRPEGDLEYARFEMVEVRQGSSFSAGLPPLG